MIVELGSLSLDAIVPGASAAAAAGVAGIGGALPDLVARLEALANFQPTPVDFAAQLSIAQSTLASVQAAISIGLSPPSIDAQVAAVLELLATLTAQLATVHARLAIVTSFQAQLSAAGIAAYLYEGAVGSLAGELGAAVGGGSAECHALALVTTDPAAWSAMSAVFKVTA